MTALDELGGDSGHRRRSVPEGAFSVEVIRWARDVAQRAIDEAPDEESSGRWRKCVVLADRALTEWAARGPVGAVASPEGQG